jgi:hypothetical protein
MHPWILLIGAQGLPHSICPFKIFDSIGGDRYDQWLRGELPVLVATVRSLRTTITMRVSCLSLLQVALGMGVDHPSGAGTSYWWLDKISLTLHAQY